MWLTNNDARSLQENIKQLQGHILDIQKREVEKMSAYGNSLAPTAEPKKEESEVHTRFIFTPIIIIIITIIINPLLAAHTITRISNIPAVAAVWSVNRGRGLSSRWATSGRRGRSTGRCSTTPSRSATTSSRAGRSPRSRRGSPRTGHAGPLVIFTFTFAFIIAFINWVS